MILGAAVVAGSTGQYHSLAPGVVQRVLQSLRGGGPAQAQVDHLGAVVGCPGDAVGDAAIAAGPCVAQHLTVHEEGAGGNAVNAHIVGRGGSDAGHMGAVPVDVIRGGAGREVRLCDDPGRCDVLVALSDAGVQNRDLDSATGCHSPGLRCIDVRIGGTAKLTRVMQAPLSGEEGVVQSVGDAVELGILDVGITLINWKPPDSFARPYINDLYTEGTNLTDHQSTSLPVGL